ncbi:collagen alpha-1(X) chain-like [Herpailurus yagouaroundi]|uniref:collagen alpha-1(X) chain-like n=1 Tax=Herpailurus yagouaroundi TaxID=1608482 RepID=UPI001AD79B8C|nr:collagen alpha-1(X) chain-like [Puma yagouaroundi]
MGWAALAGPARPRRVLQTARRARQTTLSRPDQTAPGPPGRALQAGSSRPGCVRQARQTAVPRPGPPDQAALAWARQTKPCLPGPPGHGESARPRSPGQVPQTAPGPPDHALGPPDSALQAGPSRPRSPGPARPGRTHPDPPDQATLYRPGRVRSSRPCAPGGPPGHARPYPPDQATLYRPGRAGSCRPCAPGPPGHARPYPPDQATLYRPGRAGSCRPCAPGRAHQSLPDQAALQAYQASPATLGAPGRAQPSSQLGLAEAASPSGPNFAGGLRAHRTATGPPQHLDQGLSDRQTALPVLVTNVLQQGFPRYPLSLLYRVVSFNVYYSRVLFAKRRILLAARFFPPAAASFFCPSLY